MLTTFINEQIYRIKFYFIYMKYLKGKITYNDLLKRTDNLLKGDNDR